MAAINAQEQDELTSERTRTARTILVEAALLGVWADVTLRNAPDGLGWTLWVISLALAALTVARRRGLPVNREQLAWLGIAVTCAAAFAWRDAEELRVFNVFGTLVALAMFSMTAFGVPATSILVARIRDVILGGIFTVLDIIAGAPMLVARDAELLSLPAVRGAASFTVLRAVLITIPVAPRCSSCLSSTLKSSSHMSSSSGRSRGGRPATFVARCSALRDAAGCPTGCRCDSASPKSPHR
jgi:hypothetical protein